MPVIDASVYVALVKTTEDGHKDSWAWYEQAALGNESIVAPVLILAEVAAALSRGLDDVRLARQVFRSLRRSAIIELLPVTAALVEQAAVIAADYRIRGCDAIYVALAEQVDDYLVTLDRQQLERGSAVATTRRS